MKTNNSLMHLLNLLSADSFVSGQELGKRLGVSRAAVSKQVKVIQELGVDVFSVHRKGYKLAEPINLLERNCVLSFLENKDCKLLEIVTVIESTNDFVREKLASIGNGYACLAEAQTKGRGRHGRTWFSPLGNNIYLSVCWRFPDGFQSMPGLSLAVGVALARALMEYKELQLTLKWPNDLYAKNKKLAGILVEVSGNNDGSCDAVIGVGLNTNVQSIAPIGQPWIDLSTLLGFRVDKNEVAAKLINELRRALHVFAQEGLAPFIAEWGKYDHFQGREIKVLLGSKVIEGIAQGIGSSGALLVDVNENGDFKRKEFFGGEVSVRGS